MRQGSDRAYHRRFDSLSDRSGSTSCWHLRHHIVQVAEAGKSDRRFTVRRSCAIFAAVVPTTPPPRTSTSFGRFRDSNREHHGRPSAFQYLAASAGHTACDFGHRNQKRPRAVGALHGLVGNRRRLALDNCVGQLAAGRKVEVGEKNLPLADQSVLGRDRLLDLDDHIGAPIDLRRRVDDRAAGRT